MGCVKMEALDKHCYENASEAVKCVTTFHELC